MIGAILPGHASKPECVEPKYKEICYNNSFPDFLEGSHIDQISRVWFGRILPFPYFNFTGRCVLCLYGDFVYCPCTVGNVGVSLT